MFTQVFNKSLRRSYFPSQWKKGNVIPVHKKGDKTNVTNYRPISLLSCLGKVFEKCVFKHLYNYLLEHRLITKSQSGFTPNDSAVFQLLELYDNFIRAVDDGKEIRVIFCDISKAFDRVWHRGLLFKLRRMGVCGSLLQWFENYLNDRVQRVVVEGSASSYTEIKAGVPQGSILGPLMFLIYINDIVNDLGCNIRLFADDTSLYVIVDDPASASDLVDSDLQTIHNWAQNWLVTFNPQKSEELIISRKTVFVDHTVAKMNNVEVKRVEEHKHLGLTLNKTCTWKNHILDITSKAWKRIHILQALKFKLDRKTLEIIYLTFIRPILEYADVVWDNCYIYEVEILEKIQVEAGRIVTGATKSCSAAKIMNDLGWETLQNRRKKHRLVTFYKMTNGLTPQYLTNLVPQRVHEVAGRRLRNDDDFVTPRSKTNLYQNSFLPKTVRDWNDLPIEIKSASSLNSFKNLINRNLTKPPKYYYEGERHAQILHTRLRLGCSSLNYDLFKNHVSDTDKCNCGLIESSEHFLLHCARYDNIRFETLHKITLAYDTETLLKGNNLYSDRDNEEIFHYVHEFILKSARFT